MSYCLLTFSFQQSRQGLLGYCYTELAKFFPCRGRIRHR